MPAPLARCAFLRRSGGTSTVILRGVAMPLYDTIPRTSIEYGIFRQCWAKLELNVGFSTTTVAALLANSPTAVISRLVPFPSKLPVEGAK